MSEERSPTTESSTARRHPVADLLTDEMKARVRAATFKKVRFGSRHRIAAERNSHGRCVCPLGVAVGITTTSQPTTMPLCNRLGINIGDDFDKYLAVCDFASKADEGSFDPADVYVMLGCAEARP